MTNPCPMCDSVVDNHGLQCDKCNEWIHYKCSKLPAYMIIQLSKPKKAFTCNSCVKSKFSLVFHFMVKLLKNRTTGQSLQPHVHFRPFPILTISPTYPCFPIDSISPSSSSIHFTTLSTRPIDSTSSTPFSC